MASDVTAIVYAYWGMWIAKCPRPHCYNAEREGFRSATPGKPGGLDDRRFLCSECGLACRVTWPDKRGEIASLLMQRPAPATRNWLPGETLADLLLENLQHGISPLSVDALHDTPDGKVFQLTGDTLELGPASVASDVARLALGRG